MPDVGRPTVVTEEVLRKLREAFLMGCTDVEACLFADIGTTAFYAYQKDHPEYAKEKEEWKENPVLVARQTINKSLKDNPQTASWYLERKRKNEFANRTEITGADGKPLVSEEAKKKADDAIGQFLGTPHVTNPGNTGV